MSPVLVVTLQVPPVVVSGTFSSPVLVFVINTLLDNNVPLTSPVPTFISRFAASILSKVKDPVPDLCFKSFSINTFDKYVSPVDE